MYRNSVQNCVAEGRRWTAQTVPEARRSSSLFRRGSLVGITPDARRGSVLLDNRAPHATTALKVCFTTGRQRHKLSVRTKRENVMMLGSGPAPCPSSCETCDQLCLPPCSIFTSASSAVNARCVTPRQCSHSEGSELSACYQILSIESFWLSSFLLYRSWWRCSPWRSMWRRPHPASSRQAWTCSAPICRGRFRCSGGTRTTRGLLATERASVASWKVRVG